MSQHSAKAAEAYQMKMQQQQQLSASPLSKTNEQTAMNNTQTSDWKSKLSPRARGRIQIALPTDNQTDVEAVSHNGGAHVPINEDLKLKKEFAQTGGFPARGKFGLPSGGNQYRMTNYNNGPGTNAAQSPTVAKTHDSDYGNFNNNGLSKGHIPKIGGGRGYQQDDITSHEQDISQTSFANNANFVDKSAFRHQMDIRDQQSIESQLHLPKRQKKSPRGQGHQGGQYQGQEKKRHQSNVRKNVKSKQTLAPLQFHGSHGRSNINGHKSAVPQRPQRGSDFINVYTTSLPFSMRSGVLNQNTFDTQSKVSLKKQQDLHRKLVGSRPSEYSMKNLSVRDDDIIGGAAVMPKSFLQSNADGVPVMKIDLKDPDKKSIVMSTTEFSQEELSVHNNEHHSQHKLPANKRKKKGSKRNVKHSQTRTHFKGSNLESSIINEDDAENHQSRPRLNFQTEDLMRLNEQSIDVDNDHSGEAQQNAGSTNRFGGVTDATASKAVITPQNEQIDTLENTTPQNVGTGLQDTERSHAQLAQQKMSQVIGDQPISDQKHSELAIRQLNSNSMMGNQADSSGQYGDQVSSRNNHGQPGPINLQINNIRQASMDQYKKGNMAMFSARSIDKQAVSVSQIRQSRQKVELDVIRLHNRIQLLEAEEERANKIIEDTKSKVKQILKSRAANEQFQRELERTREKELKRKQQNVRKRMQARFSNITPTECNTVGPTSPQAQTIGGIDGQSLLVAEHPYIQKKNSSTTDFLAIQSRAQDTLPAQSSIMTCQNSIVTNQTGYTAKGRQEMNMYKLQQADAIKKESIKNAKRLKKMEARETKQLQEKRALIKAQQEKVREKVEKVAAQKWAQVRQQKDEVIKNEIIKIGEKDSEAKKLERYEQKILKRLRQTHMKQQEAIHEIQNIFSANNNGHQNNTNSQQQLPDAWTEEFSVQQLDGNRNNMNIVSRSTAQVSNNQNNVADQGGNNAASNTFQDHLYSQHSIHEVPAEQLARDSIYEAEGEQSSMRQSSQPDLQNFNNSSIERGSIGRMSAEELVDPQSRNAAEQAATMKVIAKASLKDFNQNLNSSGTMKTQQASHQRLIEEKNSSGAQIGERMSATNITAAITLENQNENQAITEEK